MTHEVLLQGYNTRPSALRLGTFESYGIEKIHVVPDEEWSALAITATFNPPSGDPVEVRVPEDGTINVPAEATASEGNGSVVFCGVVKGIQRITTTLRYNVLSHDNAGEKIPFDPSESLASQVLNAALNAERSSAAANDAAQSASNAAHESAESASKAAKEAALAKPYAESAKASAELAQQAATKNGYMIMNIEEESGHLMYTRTTNLKDKIDFSIENGTNLEVHIYA